jgi:hypothetical protein
VELGAFSCRWLNKWIWKFHLSMINVHGAESLRSQQSLSHSNSQYFTEPDDSLPCSQEPATGLYPEPDESTPHPRYNLSKILRLCLLVAVRSENHEAPHYTSSCYLGRLRVRYSARRPSPIAHLCLKGIRVT